MSAVAVATEPEKEQICTAIFGVDKINDYIATLELSEEETNEEMLMAVIQVLSDKLNRMAIVKCINEVADTHPSIYIMSAAEKKIYRFDDTSSPRVMFERLAEVLPKIVRSYISPKKALKDYGVDDLAKLLKLTKPEGEVGVHAFVSDLDLEEGTLDEGLKTIARYILGKV